MPQLDATPIHGGLACLLRVYKQFQKMLAYSAVMNKPKSNRKYLFDILVFALTIGFSTKVLKHNTKLHWVVDFIND